MAKKITKKPILDHDIAFDFATKAYKKFDKIIKSIILFGSVTKQAATKKSDIDIIIIVDDCTVQWDEELIAWYRAELTKLIKKQDYTKELHINTITMTAFWHDIKIGEPVAINVIRYGEPLIDFGGFFNPLKILLAKGQIKPTPEAIYTTLRRAPVHLSRSKYNVLSAVEGLYWAMVDAAHAVLMAANEIPPSPEHIPDMLRKNKKVKIKEKYVKYYEELYKVAHSVTHGNITAIAGSKIDEYDEVANKFVQKMIDITKDLLSDEKIIEVKKK